MADKLELGAVQRQHSEIIETAKDQIFSALFILVTFLQQLSLIQVDDLDFDQWEDIFAFVRAFSLNFNLQLKEEPQDIFLLTSVLFSPLLLITLSSYNYLTVKPADSPTEKPLLIERAFVIIFCFMVVFFATGAVVFTVAEERNLGTALLTIGLYFGIVLIYVTGLYFYLKKATKNFIILFKYVYEDYKDFEKKAVILIWSTVFAFVVNVWLETAVLNAKQEIKIAYAIVGSLSVLYMLVFIVVIARLATTEKHFPRFVFILKRFYFFQENDFVVKTNHSAAFNVVEIDSETFKLSGKLLDYLKNDKFYFLIILFIEKLALVFVQTILSREVEPEYLGLLNLGVLTLIFIVVVVIRPFSDWLLNTADITSRFSNVMILASATVITFYPDEVELIRGLNGLMIVISSLTALFWAFILYRAGVISYILNLPKKICGAAKTQLDAREISNCTLFEKLNELVTNYTAGEIPQAVWKRLSAEDKLKTMLIHRDFVAGEADFSKFPGKLSISDVILNSSNSDGISEQFRRFGFACFYDYEFETFTFEEIILSENLLRLIVESNVLSKFDQVTTVHLNRVTFTNVNSVMKVLAVFPNLIKLTITMCAIKTSEMSHLAFIINSKLKELEVDVHFLTKKNCIPFLKSLADASLNVVNVPAKNEFDDEFLTVFEEQMDKKIFVKQFKCSSFSAATDKKYASFQNFIQMKRLEEPELRVGYYLSTKKETFMIRNDEVIGFTRDAWEQLVKGVNALIIPSLELLTDEERKNVKNYVNHRWEDVWIKKKHGELGDRTKMLIAGTPQQQRDQYFYKIGVSGETVLEIVLTKGVSFVAETVEALLEVGADITLPTCSGVKTLKDLMKEHEVEEVRKLLK